MEKLEKSINEKLEEIEKLELELIVKSNLNE